MTITLHLSPEAEAELCQRATSSGMRPEAVAMEALEDGLASRSDGYHTMSTDQWPREFDTWVAGQQSRNPNVDDARDSVYPDRW